jgi:L-lactate dehydrogenase complex protein LldG
MRGERDKFLSRIKRSLPHSLLPEASADHPGSFQGYTFLADVPPEKLVEDFTRELNALSGYVHRPDTAAGIVTTILEILHQRNARQIIAWDEADLEPPGLLAALAEAGIQRQESRLSADRAERQARLAELDDVPVGLSGAQGGLADTGSLALVSGSGRGRLASLLPPVHIALLPAQKLYPSLPAFLAAHSSATDEGSNLVFITGPSRTGDIEMTLSMGVHGPREVHAIIIP